MPQALDSQRDLMLKWFGDSIDEQGPMRFLLSRGYTFPRGGMIIKPTLSHTVSYEEGECVDFLCDEWDFGFDPNKPAP